MNAINVTLPTLQLKFATHAEATASAETLRLMMQLLVKNADVVVQTPPRVVFTPPPGDEPMQYLVGTTFAALPMLAPPQGVFRMVESVNYQVAKLPARPAPEARHVMVDLETWGRRPGSAIRSIGACVFTPEGLGATFYVNVSRAEQELLGLEVEPETANWWSNQSAAAREALEVGQLPVSDALRLFAQWLEEDVGSSEKTLRLWGNGAAFDNAILAEVHARAGKPKPWAFWNDRCYRTLKNLFRDVDAGKFRGDVHHALHDAEHQARHTVKILNEKDAWATV